MTIYLDDLLIYRGSEVDHEVYLCQVFYHLHKETLFVKYKKCELRKDSIEYLGHIVGQGYVHMDPSKVWEITK